VEAECAGVIAEIVPDGLQLPLLPDRARAEQLNACAGDRLAVLVEDVAGDRRGAAERHLHGETLTLGQAEGPGGPEGATLPVLLGEVATLRGSDSPQAGAHIAELEAAIVGGEDRALAR
jgi:hypothetical protein